MATLLIIDDLGAERGTEYAVENVFNVIDRRYRSGKPLIITTNLHISMLTNEQSLDKKRIYDRILELCIPIGVNGASKRTATAKEKIKVLMCCHGNICTLPYKQDKISYL